jgi:hypothetical protein
LLQISRHGLKAIYLHCYTSPTIGAEENMKNEVLKRDFGLVLMFASLGLALSGCVIYPPDIRVPFPVVIGFGHYHHDHHGDEDDED